MERNILWPYLFAPVCSPHEYLEHLARLGAVKQQNVLSQVRNQIRNHTFMHQFLFENQVLNVMT